MDALPDPNDFNDLPLNSNDICAHAKAIKSMEFIFLPLDKAEQLKIETA